MPESEFAARWAEIAADLSDLDDFDPRAENEAGSHSPRTGAPGNGHSSHHTRLTRGNDPLASGDVTGRFDGGVPSGFDGDVTSPPSHGPRDWTPSEEEIEDQEFFDYQDATDILNPTTGTSSAGSRYSAAAWVAAVAAMFVSVLMVFSVIPGGGVLAGALGFIGFGCGAFAAFASSPHQEDIDPFDDGARL